MISAEKLFNDHDERSRTQLYGALQGHGGDGWVAVKILSALWWNRKAKEKAAPSRLCYNLKNAEIRTLCDMLLVIGIQPGVKYGWKQDGKVSFVHGKAWCLYIDLPTGQVALHAKKRYAGPDYKGRWDGEKDNVRRALGFANGVLHRTFGAGAIASFGGQAVGDGRQPIVEAGSSPAGTD